MVLIPIIEVKNRVVLSSSLWDFCTDSEKEAIRVAREDVIEGSIGVRVGTHFARCEKETTELPKAIVEI